MYNFKFHLVTVVGIFLALALGIFIGSTFTEEGIIIQQRGTIERMRDDIDALEDERQEMQAQAEGQANTIALLEDWLGDLRDIYWQANPVATKALLVHDGSFNPEYLGAYLPGNVIQAQIVISPDDSVLAQELAQAIISGDSTSMAWLDGVSLEGDMAEPDYVFLALDPVNNYEFARGLASALLSADLPVVALGDTAWTGLADLVSHKLYYSVSHLDTPLGQYCLGAILQGQGGHYGMDNLLPPREVGR